MIPLPRSMRGARRGAAIADALVAWLASGQIAREEFVARVMWHCRRLDSELFGLVAALSRHLATATDSCTCRAQGSCPACRRFAAIAADIEARRTAQPGAGPQTTRQSNGDAA